MADRYKIVDESQSVHCCFRKTVVDTTRPVMIHGEHYDGKYEPMCECIDEEAAPVICDALNAADCFRWIPVSERLPEELTTVLVYSPDAPFAPSGIDLASQMDGDSWMLSDGRLAKPTHWMPLPEPPEVE